MQSSPNCALFCPKDIDLIENFGHNIFPGKFLESYYDCLALTRVSASQTRYWRLKKGPLARDLQLKNLLLQVSRLTLFVKKLVKYQSNPTAKLYSSQQECTIQEIARLVTVGIAIARLDTLKQETFETSVRRPKR